MQSNEIIRHYSFKKYFELKHFRGIIYCDIASIVNEEVCLLQMIFILNPFSCLLLSDWKLGILYKQVYIS